MQGGLGTDASIFGTQFTRMVEKILKVGNIAYEYIREVALKAYKENPYNIHLSRV